jgi:hypothetical protein
MPPRVSLLLRTILLDFSKRSKFLKAVQSPIQGFRWIWVFILLVFGAGCFYNQHLERPIPLRVDLKDYQPIALIPIADAKGFPSSGFNIYSVAQDFLQKRGYRLVNSEEVSRRLEPFSQSPFSLFSNEDFSREFAAHVQAKLLLIGLLAEIRPGKSYWGTQTEQVWEGGLFDYRMLPSYHWSRSQIRLRFKLVDGKTGKVVWMAEGVLEGPSGSSPSLGKKLTEGMLEDLPSIRSGKMPEGK